MMYEAKALCWKRYDRLPVEKTIYIKYLLSDVYDKMLKVGTIIGNRHSRYLIKQIKPAHSMSEYNETLTNLGEIEVLYEPDIEVYTYTINNIIIYYFEKDSRIIHCDNLTDLFKEIKYFKNRLGDKLEFNLSRLNHIKICGQSPSKNIEEMSYFSVGNCFFITSTAGEGGNNAI